MLNNKGIGISMLTAIIIWTTLYSNPIQASDDILDKDVRRQIYTIGILTSTVSLGMTLVNRRALNTTDAGRFTGLIGAASGVYTAGFGLVAARLIYLSDEDDLEYLAFGTVTSALGIVATYYGIKAFKHGRSGAIEEDEKVTWKLAPAIISMNEKSGNWGIQLSARF